MSATEELPSNKGRWGDDEEQSTLNLVTSEDLEAAALRSASSMPVPVPVPSSRAAPGGAAGAARSTDRAVGQLRVDHR
ncbi:hypothetical protein PSH03_001770 [Micromonospora sp. PSH03]|uniref:hypothetical protein n=1 Tax=Micromonospora salmantinae TaxID=2911211 RepID=UPI001EE7ACAB|nr:hypothetical protein [Micromonospora salmantinae]MCG5456866.1 hypothetical protein [Micromonospora salmantinae]